MKPTAAAEEGLAKIRRLAANGSSDRQIAEALGVSKRSVFRLRKRYGIASGYKPSRTLIHGRATTYTHYGCRCETCRAANARRAKQGRTARKSRLGEGEITHGASGYRNWGCRCPVCTEANTAYAAPAVQRYQERNRAKVNSKHVQRYVGNQVETLERAHHRGHQWTGAELEIAARTDLTARDVALMLGRTFAAVEKMRRKLRSDPKTINFAGIPKGDSGTAKPAE